jgi:hypothetical protein
VKRFLLVWAAVGAAFLALVIGRVVESLFDFSWAWVLLVLATVVLVPLGVRLSDLPAARSWLFAVILMPVGAVTTVLPMAIGMFGWP